MPSPGPIKVHAPNSFPFYGMPDAGGTYHAGADAGGTYHAVAEPSWTGPQFQGWHVPTFSALCHAMGNDSTLCV